MGLSKPQQQFISQKRIDAQKRGAEAKQRQRIEKTKEIHRQATKEVGKISKRELWLIGVALYWAEGSKESEKTRSAGVGFGNSDPRMIRIFLCRLLECCQVSRSSIKFVIYIHENHKDNIDIVKRFWAKTTGFSINKFDCVYYKRHNTKTKRYNTGKSYKGLLEVSVRKSTDFNRQIAGWVQGIVKQ